MLLLVHGMAGSSETWRHVMPALAERITVLAPDLLGQGQSEKPRGDYSLGAHANLLRDLLDALGHERVTIVGQSLGGGVAMQFAYQFPERCERPVLVNSGGLGDEVTFYLRMLTLPGFGGDREFRLRSRQRPIRRYVQTVDATSSDSPDG
jgi:pimeloyl-ACP methyl ester carboxylesterase